MFRLGTFGSGPGLAFSPFISPEMRLSWLSPGLGGTIVADCTQSSPGGPGGVEPGATWAFPHPSEKHRPCHAPGREISDRAWSYGGGIHELTAIGAAGEVNQVLEFAAAPGIKPVLIVALNTGMRRTEILSLNWRDVNFAKSFILIENSKNGKARKVPMNDFVYKTLKEIPRLSSEHVFFNPETNDHVKDVKTAFHAACRRAEIKGVRFHDLRHTAASKMIEAGADLVTVSKILGHSSIQMTMRYAHPTPENMKRAVERLREQLDPMAKNDSAITVPKPLRSLIAYN